MLVQVHWLQMALIVPASTGLPIPEWVWDQTALLLR
jgi:hypothetical protein